MGGLRFILSLIAFAQGQLGASISRPPSAMAATAASPSLSPSPSCPPEALTFLAASRTRSMHASVPTCLRPPQSRLPLGQLRQHHVSFLRSGCHEEPLIGGRGAAAVQSLVGGNGSSCCAPVRCSISQVHNYGTVDYEQRARLKWSSLYRRIAMMEDPGVGAGVELERWESEEKRLSKWELCRVVKELRKFRRYKLALDVSAGSFSLYLYCIISTRMALSFHTTA